MKRLFVCALVLMIFGCLGQTEPAQKDDIEEKLNITPVADKELVTAGGDDRIAVVTMRRAESGGFPHNDYEDKFLWAGLHSDSFLQLNSSRIAWLDEGESVWLTYGSSDKGGVLFNAVYLHEFQNCSGSEVSILGKDYPAASLGNGSSFGFDDKWKIVTDTQAGCMKKMIIYLDGYFEGLEDGDQIPLFRNDNTVLFKFEGLGSEQKAVVIATRPSEPVSRESAPAQPPETPITDNASEKILHIETCNQSPESFSTKNQAWRVINITSDGGYNRKVFLRSDGFPILQVTLGEGETAHRDGYEIKADEIHIDNKTCRNWARLALSESEENDAGQVLDDDAGRSYRKNETLDESGLRIGFEPAIPVCTWWNEEGEAKGEGCQYPEDRSENHRLTIPISGREWVLSALGKNGSAVNVTLAKEESNAIVNVGEEFIAGGDEIAFDEYGFGTDKPTVTLRPPGDGAVLNMTSPGLARYKDGWIRIWKLAPGYTYGASWILVSSFFNVADLSNASEADLSWEDGEGPNPKLKSIFIPRSSPVFGTLAGEG
ncbi:MAG: hypothetical protein AB1324_02635 [Candidatus Micrarchaeota archaeon]